MSVMQLPLEKRCGTTSRRAGQMDSMGQFQRVGDTKVHDINAIYSSVIRLLASGREMDLKVLFSHELAPVPVAMFNENGIKICKTGKNM